MNPRTARFVYCLAFAVVAALLVGSLKYSHVLKKSGLDFSKAAIVPAAVASTVPSADLAAASEHVRVGLDPIVDEAVISAPSGLNCEGSSAKQVRVCLITTMFKKIKLALYDENDKLLVSSTEPLLLTANPLAAENVDESLRTAIGSGSVPLTIARGSADQRKLPLAYRGTLQLSAAKDGQSIQVVNLLPLEEYLQGVVPSEVPARFEPEALKAMACVARTYTLANLKRHDQQGFDLCSGVHCHVYGGFTAERANVNEQINLTRGLAVFSGNNVADTRYHAACGGMGDGLTGAWSEATPVDYLKQHSDAYDGLSWFNSEVFPVASEQAQSGRFIEMNEDLEQEFRSFINNPPQCYCQNASRFRWKVVIPREELSLMIMESLPKLCKGATLDTIGQLVDLKVIERTPGGRCGVLTVKTDKKTFRLVGDSCRWMTSSGVIGATGLKSTLFYVDMDEQNVTFTGGGWGHGVGMCQEGAQGRALAGQTFADIIASYYPGTQLRSPDGQTVVTGQAAPALVPAENNDTESTDYAGGGETYSEESVAEPEGGASVSDEPAYADSASGSTDSEAAGGY